MWNMFFPKSCIMIYPQKGLCESRTLWGPFDVFPFYCRVIDTFKICLEERPFRELKMFYPPKGLCEAEPEWDPIDSFHFIVSREGCLTPSVYWRKFAFLKPWKCFIPRRDSAKQILRGPFDVFPFYCSVGEGVWLFQLRIGNSPFWNRENV